ncbi:phosphoribosylanthranilate isomerase [Robiginitomaculum antarcticum]|uniref:phosphoribosylanthranilate isomerase n=1 Tax=Robiginitomaculum antarcticum TaxID=437507 RepID=UPI00037F651D|nr:phosphoribosylanthranilate isomerase [Robiginitomaculum antarcticum]
MTQPVQTHVKICGLTRAEDIEAAISAGASYLGFIVEAASPRRLSVTDAARLSRPAKSAAQTVAVTVDADDDLIGDIAAIMQPDYIQLHGNETPERAAKVAKLSGAKIIKAVKIRNKADFKQAETFSGIVDFILYDAAPPVGSTVQGGHGAAFDWTMITGNPMPKIWALAGGINPDNAASAVATGAVILDVSSGVEKAAGIKDAAKIKALMKAVSP